MMDITLIQAPCWGLYAPPLALASLSAYLKSKGLRVAVMDLNIDMFYRCKDEYKIYWEEAEHEFWRNESLVEKFYRDNQELMDEYIRKISTYNSKIVGFSIYDTSMHLSLLLAKKIKELFPYTTISFGGPHCSRFMCKEFIISKEWIDVVVEGEGEETLLDIVLASTKGNILNITGAAVRTKDGIMEGAERELLSDLDALPFPDFSDFPVGEYKRNDVLPVSTSRGCINRCIFCNEWPFWRRYRNKTGQYIFQEIKYQLAKYPNIKNIEFYDSLVNGNLRELAVLCDLLIKEKIRIHWAGQAVIRREMDSALISKIKESGCGCLAYGLESGSQKVLDRIRKGFDIHDAERIIRQTYNEGIDVALNFMFGHPGETEEDFMETLDFLSKNRHCITIVNPSPSFFGIAPGTYVYNHPEEFDIATPGQNGLFWRSNDNNNNYLIRLSRFERFCKFVHSLGIKSTYPTTTLINRHRIIGDYYFHIRDYSEALKYYKISLKKESENKKILELMADCNKLLSQNSKS